MNDKKKNTIEDDIDAIRIKLYEETKHLSIDEKVKQGNERLENYAKTYGLIIAKN